MRGVEYSLSISSHFVHNGTRGCSATSAMNEKSTETVDPSYSAWHPIAQRQERLVGEYVPMHAILEDAQVRARRF